MNNNSNLEIGKFRKIPSLFFLYEVNENGTVIRNVKSKRKLKIKLDMHHSKSGYFVTFVCLKGKVRRVMMHKVVAECWLGKKPEGMEIDHIDRNSRNNNYRNLRYATHSEQMKNRVLSDKVIKQATKNCYEYTMKYVAKPVSIIDSNDREMYFESMSRCAEFLANKYGKTKEQIRGKLKQHRSVIYDYRINYKPIAETGRGNHECGKEQSTKYLVGTLDRFNDAKRSEVDDRVKHSI